MTKSVPEAEFEEKVAALLEDVVKNGDDVLVTKNGQAIARLVPEAGVSRRPGVMRGRGKTLGDIVEPLDVECSETKDGEAVATVVSIRGPMYGTIKFLGDIVEPLDVEWDV